MKNFVNLGEYTDETGSYTLGISNNQAIAIATTGEWFVGSLKTKSDLPYAKKYREVYRRAKSQRELN